jgi:aspartate/methionine/tyrosine aminotransferase
MSVSLSRRGAVEPFHAMDVLAQANRLKAQGHDVVSLAVGQPSDPAPSLVREAAAHALKGGRIGYTDALGLMELREAIARHYEHKYGIVVSAQRIAVTTGSSAGFNLAFLALFDAGDRVAISVPGYPAYRNIMRALGITPVEIPLVGRGYLTAELLEQAWQEKPMQGLLFASPANPTGAMMPGDEMHRLIGWARERGVAVISDEIYHRLNHVGPDVSAAGFEQVTVINSFSKYYCMTGWRIGWMVMPQPLVRQVERLQQSLYISAPELSQIAAIHAFDATEELERVKLRYEANRALLARRLPELGLPLAAPMDGAFYAYCDITRHSNDSMAFADAMLKEALVAATPGRDFDPEQGHRYLRFSYAGSQAEIEAAMERLATWLGR